MGELVSLKNMTVGSNSPWFVMNAALCLSVTGQLAGGQENHRDGRMSAFDPQDWWNGLGLGLVRYCLDL